MTLALTSEQIAAFPLPGGAYCQAHSFSPDGRYVACLWAKNGTEARDLWLYDRESKSFNCILSSGYGLTAAHEPGYDEVMARELSRDRWTGIGRYMWAPDSKSILLINANSLLRYDLESGDTNSRAHTHYIAFAACSPDGQQIAFHADGDLWLIDAALDMPALRLTQRSGPHEINGVADKVTREEIYNQRAFWWATNGTALFFARYDLAQVPLVPVGSGLQNDNETIAYSRPGEAVSTFSFHHLDLENNTTRTLVEHDANWPYLVGCDIGKEDNEPVLHRVNREQNSLQFIRARDGHVVHTESNTPWLNVLGGMVALPQEDEFLLLHERSGIGTIARHKADGSSADISGACGHAERILGLSEDKSSVCFIATGANPRNRHIYMAKLDGSTLTQLTQGDGLHGVTFAPDRKSWIHTIDTLGHPPRVVLETLDGKVEFEFPSCPHSLIEPLGQRTPDLITLLAADGKTTLHAALYKPANAKNAPLVVAVYGGPHVQVVKNSWALNIDLRTHKLVEAGFYVLKVDNRGSSGRGIAFEKPVHGHLGEFEVDDQVAAVKAVLARDSNIDASRVFVSGWSYGGYMALMSLCRYPDVFKNGVSGAPVIDWAEYDAQYTERYMGTPRSNAKGYAGAAILPHVRNLKAELLLIHGMKDENVLFRNSGLLLEEAARQNKLVYCLPLPRERHSATGRAARIYIEEQIFNFLVRQAGA